MVRPYARILSLLLCFSVFTAVSGETLYKWVDSQGNVHYSDKPIPGGTKIHLANPGTYTAPAVAMPERPQQNESQAPAQVGYSDFVITSPSAEQTFSNVDSVTVSVSVAPGLKGGDNITISVDGASQGPSGAMSATFSGLDRGQHTASAILIEADGQTISAPPVTFYIQKKAVGMH